MKHYRFKPLKHRRTSNINLQRRRTHKEPEEHMKNMKNVKNKEFLTSSQPKIHCNSFSKIFDPFLNQIEGYFVFESKSHYHNSNQYVLQGDRIRGSFFCNHSKLYHIHQYKFAFVKLIYLFDLFQTVKTYVIHLLVLLNFKVLASVQTVPKYSWTRTRSNPQGLE